jgi:predicted enzyme related to lactoylglutathione lyase
MSDASYRGRFVWHELMTLDVPAGISFYSKVVGWKSENWDVDPSYRLLVAGSGPSAGIMVIPADAKAMGVPPNWLTYIGTADVDASALEAEDLGATILKPPADIPNGGRFAIAQDPQGAVFALYRPAPGSPPHPDAPATPGEFSWHELATTDPEAGFDFYRKLFGWEKTSAMDMGEMGVYQMFGWGGVPRGGMYLKPANMPAPPHWMPYAMVPDAKKAAKVITTLGGTILHGPAEVPGGDWITMALDPQGAAFAVHSLAATTAKAAKAAPTKAASAASKKKASAKPKKQAGAKPKKKTSAKPKKKTSAKPKRKAAARPKRKAAKSSTRKAARKPARKAPPKAGRKTGRKAARKSPKKAARKPARNSSGRKRAPKKRSGRGKRR